MQRINSKISMVFFYSYPVQASNTTEVSIPEFEVMTSKGKLTVPAVTYQVVKTTVPSQGRQNSSSAQQRLLTVDDVVQSEIVFEKLEMWEGEVSTARLVFRGLTDYLLEFRGRDWDPDQLMRGPWLKHDEKIENSNGQQVSKAQFHRFLLAW
ncbi:MAG: hypothetical protein AAF571_11475, partial [Verrucomicrobiota bacterium]